MEVNADWVELFTSFHKHSGVFLLPWDGYAHHFSDPLVVDYYDTKYAPKTVEIIQNTPPQTSYAVIVALAVYEELGLKRERLN